MLLSIGPVIFDQVVNATDYERTTAQDFARKDVISARKGFEDVGPGDDTLTINGAVFPDHLGGRSAPALLRAMADQRTPQLILWGDGSVAGWWLVTETREKGTYLAADGHARMVEMTVTCQRCDQPSAADIFAALISLLG
jgi:phage protein U